MSLPRTAASLPARAPYRAVGRARPRSAPRALVLLRLLLWRARRPVGALLVGCACAVVVGAVRPAAPVTSAVLVLDRPVAVGEQVTADDVRLVRMPVDLVPAGALGTPDELPAATLAVPVTAGLPVVAGLFTQVGPHGPPGTVVAPVRFADPGVAAMLTPGTVVDVLSAGDDLGAGGPGGRVLARGALVLAGPGAGPGAGVADALGGGLLGGPDDEETSALVLLAVTPEESVALAGSSGLSAVFVE